MKKLLKYSGFLILFMCVCAYAAQVTTQGIANLAVTNAKIANNTIDLTAKVTGTLPIARGGTNVGAVTTSPTASAFAGWDANVNMSANNFLYGYATTAATGGTTTLTVASAQIQQFTGTSGQTVKLPVVSTLVNGTTYEIINSLNAQTLTVTSSDGTTMTAGFGQVTSGFVTVATVIDNTAGGGTSAWRWQYFSTGNTTAPLTGIGGAMNANITLPSAGAYNIGGSSQPLGNLTLNNLMIYDNFGDSEGQITVTSYPTLKILNTAPAGTIAMGSANNGSGASGGLSFAPGTASSGVQGTVSLGGHLISAAITTSPSVTAQSCVSGTPTVAGTDAVGIVTLATTCTSVTVTFGQVFGTAPVCVASVDGSAGLAIGTTSTTTTLVLTATFPTSTKVNYICIGN